MSSDHTLVFAMPAYIPDNQSLPQPRVIMSCIVRRRYVQSEVGGGTALPPRASDGGFWYRAEYPSGPFVSHDRSPSSQSRAIVSSMLDDMRLPFPLDRLRWLDVSAGMHMTEKCLTRDELVSEIARATSRAVNDTCREGRKRTKMVVSIVHKVTISEHEMRARWRRLQWRILHSRILEEEERWRRLLSGQRSALNLTRQEGAVTTPDRNTEGVLRIRVMRDSMDQERINFGAAHESMIESLNKVTFEGDQGSNSSHCVICMEEVAIGGQLIRMDCSHKFHRDCIETWLKVHPTCPLCRRPLSPKKSRDF
ncbi:hypothetical protein ACJRO7_032180 [Eucalyptus globulus]|uniref:RING-type domain-containing protein n=1 Tax=Eucalyptus globulus TaxID=34317 RepID=A0ABD3JH21_EUCGL